MNFITKLRQLDAYSKPLDDFRIKTSCGGIVTLLSTSIIIVLVFFEFMYYLETDIREELFVDSSSESERVKINFDVTFPRLPCEVISVDAMDVSGDHQEDVAHNVWKISLDKNGKPIENSQTKQDVGADKNHQSSTTTPTVSSCGSCYGAENELMKCCQTCEDVKRAYHLKHWSTDVMDNVEQCKSESWTKLMKDRDDQGCRVYGSIEVSKVAGNFHMAPGKSVVENHAHVHDLHGLQPSNFNTSNIINHFAFGDPYPGKQFPLDKHFSMDITGGSMFQFYIKSVPTLYVFHDQESILTHQFSVTKHRKSIEPRLADGLPGLFVVYEFSPIMVRITEENRSLTHFLTNLCAIIGGIFTVASIIDTILYNTNRLLKERIGKAS